MSVPDILSKREAKIQDRTLPLPSPINVTPYGASNAAIYN
jgi:hypothetical protein